VTLSLNNGALEFWIVDTEKKSVTVIRGEGVASVFTSGDSVSLAAFGGDGLAVGEIFA
jgi:Uma2 family endonuclease